MITLKTLPEATAQEVYDFVKTQLLAQNKRSADEATCLYRGPGGLCCAGGMLISDEEHNVMMEGNTWNQLVDKGLVPDTHQDLIRSLQLVHDGEVVGRWKEGLEQVAMYYSLVP